jgi:hypothetical protein
MFFLIRKKEQQIVSFSESRPTGFDPEILEVIEKHVTDLEMEDIKQSQAVFVESGQIKKIPHEKRSDEVNSLIEKIKNGTAKDSDRDQLLIHLLSEKC